MFITIRPTPDAEPLLATADPRVVAATLRAIVEAAAGPERRSLLRLVQQIEQDHQVDILPGAPPSATGAPARTPRGRFGEAPKPTICARPGCGKSFTPPARPRGSAQRYCSSLCRRLASRRPGSATTDGQP